VFREAKNAPNSLLPGFCPRPIKAPQIFFKVEEENTLFHSPTSFDVSVSSLLDIFYGQP